MGAAPRRPMTNARNAGVASSTGQNHRAQKSRQVTRKMRLPPRKSVRKTHRPRDRGEKRRFRQGRGQQRRRWYTDIRSRGIRERDDMAVRAVTVPRCLFSGLRQGITAPCTLPLNGDARGADTDLGAAASDASQQMDDHRQSDRDPDGGAPEVQALAFVRRMGLSSAKAL